MASYQPPVDTTAIFNSQSFSANNYSGESDPNKLDFPNAQGVPTMTAVNVSDGINSSLITPNGITNSGAYNFNTTSSRPIITTASNMVISNTSALTTGLNNIVIGQNAFAGATGSVQCVAIGNNALNKVVASNATAVGHGALGNTTVNNTALGSIAGESLTTGNSNVCIGFNSLSNATASSGNVVIGYNTATAVTSSLSHTNCCFIGNGSNSDNTAGHSNSVALGAGSIITGSNQITLGTSAEKVVVPSGLIQTGATTLTVSQTPQLNTANTFSQQQTYNGINVHNQNLSMAAGFGYNLVSRNFLGNYTAVTGATTIAYSTSQIYYINPISSYVITFPSTVANANVGTTFTLRITNSGVGTTITIASPFVNIFTGTSAVPVSTHTIYTSGTSTTFASSGTTAGISGTTLTLSGGTIPTLTVGMKITGGATLTDTYITAVLTATTYTVNRSQTATPTTFTTPSPLTSHTFMLLTTGIVATGGSAGFGWFQKGTV